MKAHPGLRERLLPVFAAAAMACAATPLLAAGTLVLPVDGSRPPTAVLAESGTRWKELSPAQRTALAPLEREWAGIDADRKQKWLEISSRFAKLSPEERERVQTRMSEWARMTPEQRGQVRLNFQEAKQVPSPDRKARWEAYQALPAEERGQLAARAAKNAQRPGGASAPVSGAATVAQEKRDRPGGAINGPLAAEKPRDGVQQKSNLVTHGTAPQLKPVAPVVVQARPGASTRLISRPPAPPAHQQAGLPKIAATADFVDSATLLPQRGAQGAGSLQFKNQNP